MFGLRAWRRRRTLRRQLDRLDIRAPVSGIVYGMQVFAEQSVIRPADPVLFLIPQDRPLVIATQVQVVDVDQIFVGQDVTFQGAMPPVPRAGGGAPEKRESAHDQKRDDRSLPQEVSHDEDEA